MHITNKKRLLTFIFKKDLQESDALLLYLRPLLVFEENVSYCIVRQISYNLAVPKQVEYRDRKS